MKLIIDFDRVIFNPREYEKALLAKNIHHLKFEPEAWDYLRPADYFFSDVIDFLSKYPKEDLVVISAMTPSYRPNVREFQKRKITESEIDKLVSKAIVMEGDKAPYVMAEKDDQTVFVDDKMTNVESVKAADESVVCVQMVRPNCAPEGEKVTTRDDICVISQLSELDDIIKGL